jgi:hypothetical protein
VSVVLASVLLAAIFTCPCPAMAAGGHGCCADESARIGPSDCCRASASPAQWTPRLVPAAPAVSYAAVVVSVLVVPASPSPETFSVSLAASPPRILRI